MRIRILRGYTLIELTIALALLGLIMVLLWRFGSVAVQRIAETEAPQALADANQALVGFVAAKHRLPCPDTVGDGREHCGGATIGRLPVVTLGLARADLQNIRYGVYRNAVANLDANPALDRFAPLITTTSTTYDPFTTFDYGSASAVDTPLGNVNGIDFCHALRLSGIKSPSEAGSLNIRDAGGTLVKNVAYALALPGARDADGVGGLFDGENLVAGSFPAPNQPVSANYDDVVQAVDFGQLFDRMSCGGVLSAAGHGHFNTSSAAALIHAGFVNYKSQLQVTAELASANTLLAGAMLALATGDALAASAGISYATAEALLSMGVTAGLVAIAVATEVAAIASVASAGYALDYATRTEAGAKQTILDFQPLLDESIALDAEIYTHAFAADAAGLY